MNTPDWVKEIKDNAVPNYGKGLAVKQIGDKYYLYKRSSKRVKGKKNPQVVETYIGAITQGGLILKERGLSQSEVVVCEYGFSRVLQALCPQSWAKPLKNDWKSVFLEIVRKESPNSYLLRNECYEVPENRNIQLQTRKLWDSLPDGTYEKIEPLKRVYQLYFPDRVMLAHISDEQISIASSFDVDLRETPV